MQVVKKVYELITRICYILIKRENVVVFETRFIGMFWCHSRNLVTHVWKTILRNKNNFSGYTYILHM